MFSNKIAFLKGAWERATPQVRRPAYIGMAVFAVLGALALWGISNTRNPLSMPSALGGIAVSQAIWGLKPSNLLMVLPIGSFLVVLARSFIGMKAFGLFTPMLIALAFLQIGPVFGPIVLCTAVAIGMAVAPSLLKLRMTRVGFLGVLISLVVFVLAALQGILDTNLQVDAMPVVVTALVVERWWRQWEKDGYFEAAHIAFNTMMLALVIQFVMVSEIALRLIEVSPLLLPGFAAIAITILGRYRGLRMTEIGRFFPIWYEGWMKRMGKEVAPAPVEEVEQILAARAEIDKPHDEDEKETEVQLSVFPSRPPPPGRPLVVRSLTDRRANPPAIDRRAAPPQMQANPDGPAEPSPGRLTAFEWDRVRAEISATQLGLPDVQPDEPADAPLPPYDRSTGRRDEGGGIAALFARRSEIGRLFEPALLGFLDSGGGRDTGHQSAQRDHRQVQSAPRDRAGARQGGGQGGFGGARRQNLRHHSRGLRLWSA
ncbi:7TM domain-containing protein [Aurantiacibacter odishensis]|uniref:7TM domain-containing protein n=1 Tax=Aurantiacibacter odishensis TaxID=1155476 RepID=UPI000E7143CE|nr:7TM domain-containing protein [Aurantiacibacter odishensis]